MGGTAASFGYWVRRRRLALDLTRVALARRVGCSPSAVKKIERDERRPSRTMATQLADALGIPPDQRDRFVAASRGEIAADRLGDTTSPDDPGPAPTWLSHPAHTKARPVVGRDNELARLQAHLDAALGGRGQIVFVTGEAGQGKTSLLTAFAEQAQAADSELIVARGAGTAVGGYGDPYLALREVFRMLLADPRAPLHADQLTSEQARRLWAFAPTVARTIDEAGPHLLDVVVPARTVQDRLGLGPAPPAASQPSKAHVMDEVSGVLCILAEQRPLVVLLDDMQWADAASAELLFHLTRSLVDARALVVCAHRGSEVVDGTGPAAGLLRKALLEARRDLGDVQIDLDGIDPEAQRALCDALAEQEAPGLEPAAHDELYRRTHGHPMFVHELVRELKARGDLVREQDGAWVARANLVWDRLPARVAAVIEQRLDHLSADERALLEAAAVEGESFTAETAAHVAAIDERTAHRLLADRLHRIHGLVHEAGVVRAGGHTLTQYLFGHDLFHQFVYSTLATGSRRRAHGRLAAELEVLYSDDLEPVVPRLAHHYTEAGDAERAVPYLLQTGDRARWLYAHDQAITAYEQAADFLRALKDEERLARTMMRIGLTYQTSFDHDRAGQAFDTAFALWPAVHHAGSGHPVGSATLRLASAEPESLDPTMGGGAVAIPVATNMFSGLVRYDEGTNVVPDVAERWKISEDGRRYVFHLRNDVVWTDGRPVTAHDFVFTYRRALAAATGAWLAQELLAAVDGVRDIREGREPLDTAGIHATDERTLVIELAEPTSYFIYNLANEVLMPVPQHVVEACGPNWCRPETAVSNGPFQLVGWEPGRSLTLERNPRYHGQARGNVQRVSLHFTEPWGALEHEALYLADDVDVLATSMQTDDGVIDRLRRRLPGEHTSRGEGYLTFYYWLDLKASVMKDRRIRQAMAMAVDRDALVSRWCPGMSVAATGGLVPPGIPGHLPGVSAPYEPDRATQLVADAFDWVTPPDITVIGVTFMEPLVQQLVDGWQTVGLPVRLHVCSTFDDQRRTWDSTLGAKVGVIGWIADYPDPDNFLRVAVHTFLADWDHDQYWSLLDDAARTTNSTLRLALYQDAERILAKEAVVVPLAYQPEHLMLKPWITGFPTVPIASPGFWKDVTVGPH